MKASTLSVSNNMIPGAFQRRVINHPANVAKPLQTPYFYNQQNSQNNNVLAGGGGAIKYFNSGNNNNNNTNNTTSQFKNQSSISSASLALKNDNNNNNAPFFPMPHYDHQQQPQQQQGILKLNTDTNTTVVNSKQQQLISMVNLSESDQKILQDVDDSSAFRKQIAKKTIMHYRQNPNDQKLLAPSLHDATLHSLNKHNQTMELQTSQLADKLDMKVSQAQMWQNHNKKFAKCTSNMTSVHSQSVVPKISLHDPNFEQTKIVIEEISSIKKSMRKMEHDLRLRHLANQKSMCLNLCDSVCKSELQNVFNEMNNLLGRHWNFVESKNDQEKKNQLNIVKQLEDLGPVPVIDSSSATSASTSSDLLNVYLLQRSKIQNTFDDTMKQLEKKSASNIQDIEMQIGILEEKRSKLFAFESFADQLRHTASEMSLELDSEIIQQFSWMQHKIGRVLAEMLCSYAKNRQSSQKNNDQEKLSSNRNKFIKDISEDCTSRPVMKKTEGDNNDTSTSTQENQEILSDPTSNTNTLERDFHASQDWMLDNLGVVNSLGLGDIFAIPLLPQSSSSSSSSQSTTTTTTTTNTNNNNKRKCIEENSDNDFKKAKITTKDIDSLMRNPLLESLNFTQVAGMKPRQIVWNDLSKPLDQQEFIPAVTLKLFGKGVHLI